MKLPSPKLKQKRLYVILALVSLIVGCFMYFLFRDISQLLFFKWFEKLRGVQTPFIKTYPKNWFFLFLAFYVPDILWFLSGVFLLRFLWFSDRKLCAKYIIAFYFLAIAFEFAQMFKWIPGTFDWMDIASLSATAILEGVVYTFFNSIRRNFV